MLEFKNVTHSFGESDNKVVVLNNISLKINTGEFVIIIGANGSGKSTFLNAISGQIMVQSGQIQIDGNTVQNLPEYKRSPYIARIFQNPTMGTVANLSVIENMRLASLRNASKGLKVGLDAKFTSLVKDKIALLGLGLENRTNQLMGTLSGGQRQALTLVMALLCDAKLLLMDEPTAALDPKSANALMQSAATLIKEFKITTLMVTHQLHDAINYGNRLLLFKDGSIIKDENAAAKNKLKAELLLGWLNNIENS
jgi:putative ABC transport system ATP-binding protein